MDFSNIDLTWVTSAAVLGFIGSLTVAVVNAIAARRLERAKALRAYREDVIKRCRAYIHDRAQMVGGYRQQFRIHDWEDLREPTRLWLLRLAEPPQSDGAIYTPSWIVPYFADAMRSQRVLTHELAVLVVTAAPSSAQIDRVNAAFDQIMDAYTVVEMSTEVFVYGGLQARWQTVRRGKKMHRRLDALDAAKTPIPTAKE